MKCRDFLLKVHDQSGSSQNRYNPSKQIRFKTSMLRSDLYDLLMRILL